MRGALSVLGSAIIAALAGTLMQQYGLALGATPMQSDCFGVATFAGVLLGCLVVVGLVAGERVER